MCTHTHTHTPHPYLTCNHAKKLTFHEYRPKCSGFYSNLFNLLNGVFHFEPRSFRKIKLVANISHVKYRKVSKLQTLVGVIICNCALIFVKYFFG